MGKLTMLFAILIFSQFHLLFGDSIDSRIIHGTEVKEIEDVPYQVAITVYPTKSLRTFCDGALISDRFALTAAVCFRDTLSPRYVAEIKFGAAKLNEILIERIATKTHIHLKFDYPSNILENNIAILEFHPVPISNKIQPVGLPSLKQEQEKFLGQKATITGRGAHNNKEDFTQKRVLRSGTTEVEDNGLCRRQHPRVIDRQLCTSYDSKHAGICWGDEGSPLVAVKDNKKILIGIGSFKDPNGCEIDKYSVFTRITLYLEWIYGVTSVEISKD